MEEQSKQVDTEAASTEQFQSAAGHGASWFRLIIVAAAALAFDLWSKAWAFDSLDSDEIRTFIPGFVTFRRSLNEGALFGMGKGMSSIFILASFLAIGFVVYLFSSTSRRQPIMHFALAFILAGALGNLYDRVFCKVDRITIAPSESTTGWSGLMKIVEGPDTPEGQILVGEPPDGANAQLMPLDNISEMEKFGVVRDFIKFEPQIKGRDLWPWVFNIADSLLVVGVGVLVVGFWRSPVPHSSAASQAESTASS
jgi:signal peptidase II